MAKKMQITRKGITMYTLVDDYIFKFLNQWKWHISTGVFHNGF